MYDCMLFFLTYLTGVLKEKTTPLIWENLSMEQEEKFEKGVLNPVAQCHLSLKSACILEWHVNEYLFSLGLDINSTIMKLKLYVHLLLIV